MPELSTFEQVLENVRINGQILPVYLWDGRVLDGEKRHHACLVLGREPQVLTLETEAEAATLLWSLHPERAWLTFGVSRSFGEFCALTGARPLDLLRVKRALFPEPEKKRGSPPRRRYGYRVTIRFLTGTQRRLYELAKRHRVTIQELVNAALEAVSDRDLLRAVSEHRIARALQHGANEQPVTQDRDVELPRVTTPQLEPTA